MSRSILRPIALTLAVAILLMLGAATSGAFAHEVKHAAHHTAGMHATGLCAWMCAASGAVTTAVVPAVAVTVSEDQAQPFVSGLRSSECLSQLQARAPPVLS
jgi:uncharacterized membrane protein YqhA